MNKRKLKLKYFFIGFGVFLFACFFSLSFSSDEMTIEINNVEALAEEERFDPTKYCKQAGGICYLMGHIVWGLQLENKKE